MRHRFTTVYITPPPGPFSKPELLDNQEGANTERYAFGKLSVIYIPTPTFSAPKDNIPTVVIPSTENRHKGGVIYIVVYDG